VRPWLRHDKAIRVVGKGNLYRVLKLHILVATSYFHSNDQLYHKKKIEMSQIKSSLIYECFDQFFEIKFFGLFFDKDSLILANDRKILQSRNAHFRNAHKYKIKLFVFFIFNVKIFI